MSAWVLAISLASSRLPLRLLSEAGDEPDVAAVLHPSIAAAVIRERILTDIIVLPVLRELSWSILLPTFRRRQRRGPPSLLSRPRRWNSPGRRGRAGHRPPQRWPVRPTSPSSRQDRPACRSNRESDARLSSGRHEARSAASEYPCRGSRGANESPRVRRAFQSRATGQYHWR